MRPRVQECKAASEKPVRAIRRGGAMSSSGKKGSDRWTSLSVILEVSDERRSGAGVSTGLLMPFELAWLDDEPRLASFSSLITEQVIDRLQNSSGLNHVQVLLNELLKKALCCLSSFLCGDEVSLVGLVATVVEKVSKDSRPEGEGGK